MSEEKSSVLKTIKSPASIISLAMLLMGGVFGYGVKYGDSVLILIALLLIFSLAIIAIIVSVKWPGTLFHTKGIERHESFPCATLVDMEKNRFRNPRKEIENFLVVDEKEKHRELDYVTALMSWIFSLEEPVNTREVKLLIFALKTIPKTYYTAGPVKYMINLLGRNQKVSSDIRPFFVDYYHHNADTMEKEYLKMWLKNKPEPEAQRLLDEPPPSEPCSPEERKAWRTVLKRVLKEGFPPDMQ